MKLFDSVALCTLVFTISAHSSTCLGIYDATSKSALLAAASEANLPFDFKVDSKKMREGIQILVPDLVEKQSIRGDVSKEEITRIAEEYSRDPLKKSFVVNVDGARHSIKLDLPDMLSSLGFFAPVNVIPKNYKPVQIRASDDNYKELGLEERNWKLVSYNDIAYYSPIGVERKPKSAVILGVRMSQFGSVYADVKYYWKDGVWKGGAFSGSKKGPKNSRVSTRAMETTSSVEIMDLRQGGDSVKKFAKLPKELQKAILAVVNGSKASFGSRIFDKRSEL